jgi:hypothetical protein
MNDVKRLSRNLRSDNTKTFNIQSLSSKEEVREIRVKRDFEKRLDNFAVESGLNEDQIRDEDDKMRKLESFVKEDYFRSNKIHGKKIASFFLSLKSVFIGLTLSLASLYLVFTYILNKATIEIEPKSFESQVSGDIVLSNATTPESFEYVELNKETISKLGKLEEKKVSSKASGTINIYNNFNESSQKLVKNTRFESVDGKIFRITDSVIVPGLKDGKSGMVKANVVANFVGEEYNILPGKFTIPGFKGSARYNAFYAESDTQMKGGSNSFQKIVNQEKINSLKSKAQAEISKLVSEDLPKVSKTGYIVAPNIFQIDYTDNINKVLNGEEEDYKVFGKARVMIINEKALASSVAAKINPAYLGGSVSFVNYKKDLFEINFASTTNNVLSDASMLLKVSSPQSRLVYDIDEAKIITLLLGKDSSKENFSQFMANFVGIQKAKPTLTPFWIRSFPTSPSKIDIINVSK